MTGFRLFIEMEIKSEVEDSLEKLPKSHRTLTKGYKFKFESGCTLKGEKDAIGMIHLNDNKKKEIHVASPWRYGREFAMLHEVAHLVYEKFCDKEWQEAWKKVVKKNKKRLKQNCEELWCHAYANHFVANKVVIHTHPDWDKYMEKFCKITGNKE